MGVALMCVDASGLWDGVLDPFAGDVGPKRAGLIDAKAEILTSDGEVPHCQQSHRPITAEPSTTTVGTDVGTA